MGEQFIRLKEDIEYKILNELMRIWFLDINEYVECDMYKDIKKDTWYMINKKDVVDMDESVSIVIKLISQEELIIRCKGFLDFLGQEEQLKLF